MDLGTPTHLVTFDPAGNVTDLGPSVARIDGIAFTVAVPEPSTLALLMAPIAMGLLDTIAPPCGLNWTIDIAGDRSFSSGDNVY